MMARQLLRYVIAGGVNTAVTYAMYLALLSVMGYRWAYGLAFAAGIGMSWVLLRHLVFVRPGKPFSLAYVSASHGLQFVLGLAVVEAWVAWLQLPAWLAPLAALTVSLPLMFVLQRWIFTPHVPSR